MIERQRDEERLRNALARSPIVVLTGPRQAGKSTMARRIVDPPRSNFFDLEDPRDLARLGEPSSSLPKLHGTVVIDEAQHRHDLFPILRVLADEDSAPGRFLVLGSASPDLVGLASESLAGRVALVELGGLSVNDVGREHLDRLWYRGGLPRAYLAPNDARSQEWMDDYISTFLERDLGNLGIRTPAVMMRRFWTMVAHYHGQTWNGAELARALGLSQPTIRRYLDELTDALVLRQLQPWFANVAKRQVRAPKVYVRDSGTLHRLLGIRDSVDLLGHPKVGASWEGFVLEQILRLPGVADPWFWGTQAGAEIDLLVSVDGARVGVEIKRTDRPAVTPSMRHALRDLELKRVLVVHAGDQSFELTDSVTAVSAGDVLTLGRSS